MFRAVAALVFNCRMVVTAVSIRVPTSTTWRSVLPRDRDLYLYRLTDNDRRAGDTPNRRSTITVTGTNDAPVAVAAAVGTDTENADP